MTGDALTVNRSLKCRLDTVNTSIREV
ncbi:hypothetical protein QO004_006010 [Rhizobium mesoamericanum]|nr:hypothetical protein [Rhizobium mesoamericanum]